MDAITDENISDEEIFFGKITLKEVKKRIFINQPHRQTITCLSANKEQNNEDESFGLIEMHSEPDIVLVESILDSDLKSISCLPANKELINIEDESIRVIETHLEPDQVLMDNIRDSDLKSISCLTATKEQNNENESTKIIETHSEPDLVLVDNILDSDLKSTSCLAADKEQSNEEESTKIIEMHSEPDLVSVDNILDSELKSISSPDFNSNGQRKISDVKSDDSFIRLEKMVSELCMSPTENTHPQLDSTLDVVDFILNTAEIKKDNIDGTIASFDNINIDGQDKEETTFTSPDIVKACNSPEIKSNSILTNTSNILTNNVLQSKTDHLNSPQNKNNILQINQSENIFKTPKNPVSIKKQVVSTKKTPNRTNAYQHITSPVASYIKNCPQVPLLKEVHPRKPLPGASAIPKLLKTSTQNKPVNKENVQIPSIAYKSAKKTKMVSAPNPEKMPQGEWTNKLTSSLKKPVVIKHDYRVNNAVKNLNKRQEDSFANLSLQQAEISVCTKKSAFS